jgi:hypothetical protein
MAIPHMLLLDRDGKAFDRTSRDRGGPLWGRPPRRGRWRRGPGALRRRAPAPRRRGRDPGPPGPTPGRSPAPEAGARTPRRAWRPRAGEGSARARSGARGHVARAWSASADGPTPKSSWPGQRRRRLVRSARPAGRPSARRAHRFLQPGAGGGIGERRAVGEGERAGRRRPVKVRTCDTAARAFRGPRPARRAPARSCGGGELAGSRPRRSPPPRRARRPLPLEGLQQRVPGEGRRDEGASALGGRLGRDPEPTPVRSTR